MTRSPAAGRGVHLALAAAGVIAVSLALVAPPVAATVSEPSASPSDDGGVRAQVVGGTPVDGGQSPWMVALVAAGRPGPPVPFCGGSLVAPEWVLTAAHCVDDLAGDRIAAHVGMTDVDEAGEPVGVRRVVVHPAYEDRSPWPHDVALLELDEAVEGPPIALAPGADWVGVAPDALTRTVGWGAIDPDATEFPTVLHAATTPVLSDLACAAATGPGFDAALMLCAGADGKASCTGDSGGPLIKGQGEGEGLRQVGVVSSGRGRCGSNPHNLYVEVAGVLPWIEAVTGIDAGADTATRIAGDGIHDTAAAITRSAYEAGQGLVFVASSETFADGLVGGALAAQHGPLVLVPPDGELPAVVGEELARLAPAEIVVFGGEDAVSPRTADALGEHAPVSRIAGVDRFATAAQVARQWGTPSTVYVATGHAYPDALAAVPLTVGHGPVVLTRGDRVPPATAAVLAELAPEQLVVLGGTAAVSEPVEAELGKLAGASVRRVAGADRYETAARIALDGHAPPAPSTAYVVTGEGFADALVGGVVAGAHGAPTLLVHPDRPPEPAARALERLDPRRVLILGDAAAVPPEIAHRLHADRVRSARGTSLQPPGHAADATSGQAGASR